MAIQIKISFEVYSEDHARRAMKGFRDAMIFEGIRPEKLKASTTRTSDAKDNGPGALSLFELGLDEPGQTPLERQMTVTVSANGADQDDGEAEDDRDLTADAAPGGKVVQFSK